MTHYENPVPTTDMIIEYRQGAKEGIVLVTRRGEPHKGMLALPGGFAEKGISYQDNATKEGLEETSLVFVPHEPERPFCVHSNPHRDTRDKQHVTSNTYIGRGFGTLCAGDDAASASLYTIDEVNALLGKNSFAFDHEKTVRKYLVRGYRTDSLSVGMIGRFKPLHNGTYQVLEQLCLQADKVIIGIGSSQTQNARNPFSADETQGMLSMALARFNNISYVHIPDFGHLPQGEDGSLWTAYVKEHFTKIDAIFTSNPHVAKLLKESYTIFPASPLSSTTGHSSDVRLAIANEKPWEHLVPAPVANYMREHKLDQRIKTQYGEYIRAHGCLHTAQTLENETLHAQGKA